MANSFSDKIRNYINSNGLLEERTKVIVGLSGGADSTALLLILLRLGYQVHAVHCNFHLRGSESDRDQQFVTDLCKKLGVELEICQYNTQQYASDHGISIEMAARELRYTDFERIMHKCGATAICIAHHRDDSVETVLLNLIRGTGIENWLNGIGQPYVTDSTNLETDYTRNKIRNQLLPLMRSINPDADNAINDTAKHLQQTYAIYSKAIQSAVDRIVTISGSITTINIPELNKEADTEAVLFEILAPMGFNSTQIENIVALLNSQPGAKFISATHQLIKERDSLTVSPLENSTFKPLAISLEPDTTFALPDGSVLNITTAQAGAPISRLQSVATFDADLIKGPVIIRPWQEGDWFIPFGMKGRKLVSDYLTDCKVSAFDRQRQLVITYGNDIIWVVGHRTDNRYRVTDKTRTQLILSLS